MKIVDRLISAAIGAVLGGVLGAGALWLLAIYSRQPGLSTTVEFAHFSDWITGGALLFGLIGLLKGPNVGTLIGESLNSIYEAERDGGNPEIPRWLFMLLMIGTLAGAWWIGKTHL